MKQILVKKGQIFVDDIPSPVVSDNGVLVQVIYSCISAGTEMMGVNESEKSLIKKAIEQPEKVQKALNILKNQGISSVIDKIKEIDDGKPTGYSAAGIVIGIGKNIFDIKIGDRVACAGAGMANHAEFIDVPRNLVMNMPGELSFKNAATVALGGIAMQGLRRTEAKLGDVVAVIGLGIIGQLITQMFKLCGCRVIGIDIDERRLSIAKETGCDYVLNPLEIDVVKETEIITDGHGVDAAIIAAASNSNEILSQAFNICRKKGKVVLVGVVGNEYKREDMYMKELDFIMSTSYGPGRYDSMYESKGIDYPYPYVRWTENRNMEEYLRLVDEGKIKLSLLIDKIYDIDNAPRAYESLKSPENKPLIVLLKYDDKPFDKINNSVYIGSGLNKSEGKINVAIIGAGEFARGMHLPNLKKLNDTFNIHAIMSRTGTNAKAAAQQYEARYASTDYGEILDDPDVDMVMICTRHNLHAQMAIAAMNKGKAVFVEKPMALDENEMLEVLKTIEKTGVPYTVGFNRRFSKYVVEAKKHINDRKNPMIINYVMNAGYIPLDHWVHTEEGGGRIIGEGCHIFDLFNYLTNSRVDSISINDITPKTKYFSHRDNVVATVKYNDGSICTLTYTALGSNKYPKELCQIFYDGKVIEIVDYKRINGYGVKLENLKSKVAEKGQYEELIEFSNAIKNGKNYSIPLWQLEQTTRTSYIVDKEANR